MGRGQMLKAIPEKSAAIVHAAQMTNAWDFRFIFAFR
jgi:hypothetical protein